MVNTRFHAGIDVQSVTHCSFSLKKIKCPKGELVFSSVQLISLDYFSLFPGCSIQSIIFLHPTNNYNFIRGLERNLQMYVMGSVLTCRVQLLKRWINLSTGLISTHWINLCCVDNAIGFRNTLSARQLFNRWIATSNI